ncbi:MAG: M91 family zinc metallopeptidase, partial [Thermoanaerobaculia bacterium]
MDVMKVHTKRNATASHSTALKASRPFSIHPPPPAPAEADLKAWQERASRFGHYFDGPALQARGEAAVSGAAPVIQRKRGQIDDLILTPEELARAREREEDRKKLSAMFTINEEKALDPKRKSNVVDKAKFNEIADLYSRIREGGTTIKFAEDQRPGFKGETMKDIAKLLQTENGRDLLREITNEKYNVTLRQAAKPDDADHEIVPRTKPRTDSDAGNASNVQYVPGADMPNPNTGRFAATSDTTLFHELRHAHLASYNQTFRLNNKLTASDLGNPNHK